MILKGRARSSGADLALHLMNALDNESIDIAELCGAVADDLYGAFAEIDLVARGTRAQQPFYSLAINPSAELTRDQYFEAIERIEKRLGLSGQPRAVVFHVKRGESGAAREHCHVVWSRIDVDRMKAIHLSHDKSRLMDLACEIAHRYGLELPPGLKAWEAKQAFNKEQLEPSLSEKAQAEKTGITSEQRRAEITACYEKSDSAAAFVNALEEAGYVLARGDKRAFVVVDRFGSPHSLTRYVKGHSAKDIKAKLATLQIDRLPDVDQAKETMQARAQAAQDRRHDQRQSDLEELHRKRDALLEKQRDRRADLAGREQELLMRQARERLLLHEAQKREALSVLYRVRKAVAEFIGNTPGLRSVLGPIQKLTGLDPGEKQRLENEALAGRHDREKLDIAREKRTLDRLESRERGILERRLRKAEGEERALSPDTAREATQASEDHGHAQVDVWESRRYRWGELSDTFNAHVSGAGNGKSGGDDDGDGPDGPGPDEPDDGRPHKRPKGYGMRRDE